MTHEQALTTAAHWWATMIVLGFWDNGDSESERIHGLFRQAMPTPSLHDKTALAAALRDYFTASALRPETGRDTFYCDYAAAWLDTVLHTINPAWNSRFCGPQKAGTRFEVDPHGDVTVLAKRGYGKPWEPLAPHP